MLTLTLAGCDRRPGPVALGALCVAALIVLGPLVALKLPIQDGGNDKPQYLAFMAEMRAFGITHFVRKQPELISFASLYAAAALFGTNDVAFLALFDTYFALLLVGAWRAQPQAIPLFLVLFLAASSFFGTYGNLLRQSMAFPFLFMMINARSRFGAASHMALSGLAHLPALVIALPYVLLRCAGRWATPVGIGMAALSIVASRTDWISLAPSGNPESYLTGKIDIYTSWDNASTAGVTLFAFALYALCLALWRYGSAWRTACDPRSLELIRRYLFALTIAAVALVGTQSMTKVYERIYINFFVTALMTLALMISRLQRGLFKAVVLHAAVGYGIYGFEKNLGRHPLLFNGDGYAYLVASLVEIYREFLMTIE
ncbi:MULTISPECIES: hypothetical protein [Burkholderia]|uniref:hypothetical protein n=1 Tax=Burkholderia TaxID=32008 RepID=UPI00117D9CA5|nr:MULTISPECIES: hypothetical protein [Burkholderia]